MGQMTGALQLALCMLANFSCFCCRMLTFFQKKFWNTIRVSNGLDPDQDLHFVCPDLGPYCLQRLLADDKSHGPLRAVFACPDKYEIETIFHSSDFVFLHSLPAIVVC